LIVALASRSCWYFCAVAPVNSAGSGKPTGKPSALFLVKLNWPRPGVSDSKTSHLIPARIWAGVSLFANM
jgi:hypothetical protein